MSKFDRRVFCGGLIASAACLVGMGGPVFGQTAIGTALTVAATKLPATLTTFTTSGYAVAGDKGNATYVRAATTLDARLVLLDGGGGRWTQTDLRLRPEMFGGKADGVTDSAPAINRALLFQRPIDLQPGNYVIGSTILVDQHASTTTPMIEVAGAGMGVTSIIIAPFVMGLHIIGNQTVGSPIYVHDLTIGRTNAAAFTGAVGIHTIQILYGSNVLVSNVEEYGAIGMGILLTNCAKFEITGCYVHDHKGGSAHLSGTDGIHVDTSVGPGLIHNNHVKNNGDDAISHGSYVSTIVTGNINTYNNLVENSAGAIKIFGNCNNINITNNIVTNAGTAGACLWDDRAVGQSFNITNVTISGNTFTNCGGSGASGGVYLAQPTGNGVQQFQNISITGNNIVNCTRGISVYSAVPTKSSSNIVIQNNTISGSVSQGMYLNTIGGNLLVDSNWVVGSGLHGISFGAMYAGAFTVTNNAVVQYAIKPLDVPQHYAGIWVAGGVSSSYMIQGNMISNAGGLNNKSWAIYNNLGITPLALTQLNNQVDPNPLPAPPATVSLPAAALTAVSSSLTTAVASAVATTAGFSPGT